jgi:hypothetical protein
MLKRTRIILIAVIAVSLFISSTVMAQAEKPKIAPLCKQCHAPDESLLRGTLGIVFKGFMQVNVGPAKWVVKLDKDTKLQGAEDFSKIPIEKEIAVSFVQKDGEVIALAVSVKPPAIVPEEKLVKVDEMARLVALGPEKGNFVLIDSRPASRYLEGHIPGAILIPDPEFEKHADKLPKDMNKLLIFYCAGVT